MPPQRLRPRQGSRSIRGDRRCSSSAPGSVACGCWMYGGGDEMMRPVCRTTHRVTDPSPDHRRASPSSTGTAGATWGSCSMWSTGSRRMSSLTSPSGPFDVVPASGGPELGALAPATALRRASDRTARVAAPRSRRTRPRRRPRQVDPRRPRGPPRWSSRWFRPIPCCVSLSAM